MDSIFNRISVRRYQNLPVEEEKINMLLKAAMAAPSAGNQQPWEFYVVTDRIKLRELSSVGIYSGCVAEAPIVIVPAFRSVNMPMPEFVQIDMSNCTENILLEAVQQELGAVWLGVAPHEVQMRRVSEILKIPHGLMPFAMVACGYPAEKHVQQNRFEESRIHRV